MKKLDIVTEIDGPTGIITGWLRDKPGVVYEAINYTELVSNIKNALETFTQAEKQI